MQTAQPTAHLSAKLSHTLGRIFEHPAGHNLEWHDVIALVEHLGMVEENDNGHLKFTVDGNSVDFHRSRDKDVTEVQQALDLRHFLESAGYGRSGASAKSGKGSASSLQLLAVVSQKETLVFRSEEKGSVPEHLRPYDPHHALHHANHSLGDDLSSRLPENITYYKAIAATLADADEVLLMGNGTGASSAMTHLQEFLAAHHPEIAAKIVANDKVDVEALTEGQMLQQARAFFAQRDAPETKMS